MRPRAAGRAAVHDDVAQRGAACVARSSAERCRAPSRPRRVGLRGNARRAAALDLVDEGDVGGRRMLETRAIAGRRRGSRRVDRVRSRGPAPRCGEIVHARDVWAEPGGGGAVTAMQLRPPRGVHFFTAIGSDELGARARGPAGAGRPSRGGRPERAPAPGRRVRRRRRERHHAPVARASTGRSRRSALARARGPRRSTSPAADEDALRLRAARARSLQRRASCRRLPRRAWRSMCSCAARPTRVSATSSAAFGLSPGSWWPRRGPRAGRTALRADRSNPSVRRSLPGPVVDAYGAGDSFAAGLATPSPGVPTRRGGRG